MKTYFLLYVFSPIFALLFSLIGFSQVRHPPQLTSPSLPQEKQNYYELAAIDFQKEFFLKAIAKLRKHLRDNPKDMRARDLIGASYFHLGMSAEAIDNLKRSMKKTQAPSYNLYYLGVSHLLQKKFRIGIFYLKKASLYNDEFASRATFEIGMAYYHRRDFPKASFWFRQYSLRFPRAIYQKIADRALKSINKGKYISYLRGLKFPDPKLTLYKYSSWSLFNYEHFWFLDIGSGNREGREKEPLETGGLRNSNSIDYYLTANFGLGIGPIKRSSNTLSLGYIYNQTWFTTPERLQRFQEDYFDFDYFLYRPDLLYRRHNFYGEFNREIFSDFILGFFGQMSFERVGSSLMTSPEDSQVQKSLRISTASLLIPYVSAVITDNLSLELYTYMYKELQEDDQEFSYKTYDLSESSPLLSVGLRSHLALPDYGTAIDLNLYRFEFVFNDLWLDYKREGASAKLSHELFNSFFLSLNLGFYVDTYLVPHLQVGGCRTSSKISQASDVPSVCERTDTGMAYDAEIYWDYTNFSRISLKYSNLENKNSAQTQFETNKTDILMQVTLAFPSVDDIINNVKKYDEYRFYNKETPR